MKYFTLKFYNGPLNGDSFLKRIEEPKVGDVIDCEYRTGTGKKSAPYKVAAIKDGIIKSLWANK